MDPLWVVDTAWMAGTRTREGQHRDVPPVIATNREHRAPPVERRCDRDAILQEIFNRFGEALIGGIDRCSGHVDWGWVGGCERVCGRAQPMGREESVA